MDIKILYPAGFKLDLSQEQTNKNDVSGEKKDHKSHVNVVLGKQ